MSKVVLKRLFLAAALVLAGVGGGAVIASTRSKPVTFCVSKKTGELRVRIKNKPCISGTERAVVLNRKGRAGARGPAGAAGPAGATGPAGASSLKITELSVCDGSDVGTVADELCKIGMRGPGGGPVFFIDNFDQYPSFCAIGDCNYLEASPADVDEADDDFTSAWCSDVVNTIDLTTWSNGAVGAGRSNTETADTSCTSGAIQTAVDYTAPTFNGVAKDDWWLPSLGELMSMYVNLRQAGVGGFASNAAYWSSSEAVFTNASRAWYQGFSFGDQYNDTKTSQNRVRPVRGF